MMSLVLMFLLLAGCMTSMAAEKKGWVEEDGIWYFYRDGEPICDEWKKSGSDWFYLDENGKMSKGELVSTDDKFYYTDPGSGARVIKRWVELENLVYYFDENGEMSKGELISTDDKLYYTDPDSGARVTRRWVELENLDNDGCEDLVYYYFNNDGKAARGGIKRIAGKSYSFDKFGHLLTDETATPSDATLISYLEVYDYEVEQEEANTKEECKDYAEGVCFELALADMPRRDDLDFKSIVASPSNCSPASEGTATKPQGKNGKFEFKYVIEINAGESSEERTIKTGILTMTIKATPYEETDTPSRPSYSSSSGGSSTRTQVSAEERYLQEVAKRYTVSGTWENADGRWKLKKSDGSYVTNDWAYIKGQWYFLGEDTFMKEGWITINNVTYYLKPESGELLTGWQQIDNKWYFMDNSKSGNQGAVLKNATTPDGYQVGADGVWVPAS